MEALGINDPVDSSTLSTSDHFDSFTESEDSLCIDLDFSGSSKMYCLWILYSRIQILKKLNKILPL